MDPDFAQRRRLFVAAAITVVAVPAAFLFGRNDSTAEVPPTTLWAPVGPTVPDAAASAAAAGAAPEQAPAAGSHGNPINEVLGTTPGGYLGGTVAPGANDPPMIAVPRPRDTAITGTATFGAIIDRTTSCLIPRVPMGTEVTVTNLDNSRSVKCQATAIAAPQDTDVIMHVDAFSQIADITEAPVPVEISW